MHVYNDDVKHEEFVSLSLASKTTCVHRKNPIAQAIGKYFITSLIFEKDALKSDDPSLFLRIPYELDNTFYISIDGNRHEFQFAAEGEAEDTIIKDDLNIVKPEPTSFGGDIAWGLLLGVAGVDVEIGEAFTPLELEYEYAIDEEIRKEILHGESILFRFYINRIPYEFSISGRKMRRIKEFLLY